MKDVAGRTLTNYFGPYIETPRLGRLTVVGGTGNTRIYRTSTGARFEGPASAAAWALEAAAMRAGVLSDPYADGAMRGGY